jgi:hypothetical protein
MSELGRTADDTEIGAAGGDLRYWLAKEALRQGELRLAGQAATLQAMETRATSLLTWSVTLGIALVAAATDQRFRFAAAAALAVAMCAAIASVWAMWPRRWLIAGQRYSDMEHRNLTSELEHLEAMAQGAEAAAEDNERRIRRFATALRCAWVSLVAAPAAAALAAVVAGRL